MNNPPCLISLVSGTYNRIDMLKKMIESFRVNIPKGAIYEIVLVDGGSTDGTIAWAKSQTDIHLIEDGALLGAISAFTRGAFAAVGKYVLLANDDIEFRLNSIIPAIVHLENNMTCGAVAFADNREIPGTYTKNDYKTLQMGAWINGRATGVVYAQVGLFRKWLGDKVRWWMGEHDEMIGAQVYAGDNSLSAQIWHYGYSVDTVPECIVEDFVAMDELRQINYEKGIKSNDSHHFYDQWPEGRVIVMSEPQIPQQDKRAARILYLPIYEPGWAVQKHPVHGKNGLRKALAKAKNKFGENHIVMEFDYLSVDPSQVRSKLIELVEGFKPDLIISQIQSWLPITADILRDIKARSGATVINWNGDQALGGLVAPEMLTILRYVDLQLITNLEAAPVYDQNHIKWAYWQIGYEEPDGDLEQNVRNYFSELGRQNPFENFGECPVIYLASLRSPERLEIAQIVHEFGGKVLTPGDEYATLYNFSTSTYAYRHSKLIVSDNGFNSPGFVSNRLFQALAAGGGVVLQQHVDELDNATGLIADYHYIEWFDLPHLKQLIAGLLAANGSVMIPAIAKRGTDFVRANFSFDAQVAELMEIIKEMLGSNEQMSNTTALLYVGQNRASFGLGNMFPSGTRYEYQPGKLLFAYSQDVDTIMNLMPGQWQRAGIE